MWWAAVFLVGLCVVVGFFALVARKKGEQAQSTGEQAQSTGTRKLDISYKRKGGADLEFLRAFIDEIAPRIGPGQSYVDTNDKFVDWRGTTCGFPLRIKCDRFPYVHMTLKVEHHYGTIDLEWDERKVPQVGAPPVWDESDTQHVFVGKGVFLKGSAGTVNEQLERFRRLPPELSRPLVEAMSRDHARFFRIRDEVWVEFEFLRDMPDPWSKLVAHGQFLGWLAEKLTAGGPPEPTASDAQQSLAALKITCAYCGSLYLLVPQTAAHQTYGCPNCGAPPTPPT